MPALSIGQVAESSGVKVPTIRYYERIGLLAAPHAARAIAGSTARTPYSACASSAMLANSASTSRPFGR